MYFDYNKLRGRIKEYCGTQATFAEEMGLSNTSLSNKLNNKIEFSQIEIEKALVILKLKKEDIPVYFFNKKVQKTEQEKISS